MITLKNESLTCRISEYGAEIRSIVSNGCEYMWGADPNVWGQSAPIMFPICGGLKNGKYILDGCFYSMPKHGFARKSEFKAEQLSDTEAFFVLRDTELTREMYPFKFEFKVSYRLEKNSLYITYRAENLDSETMYFSFGAHEGYACPGGIEEYDVVFPQDETLYAYALNGELLTDYTKLILDGGNTIPLKESYFYLDALVFKDLKSRTAKLVHRESGRAVDVDFNGFDYFLIWHKFGAPYICLEPWCGIQDIAGSTYELSEKAGINAICGGEAFERTHVITVN